LSASPDIVVPSWLFKEYVELLYFQPLLVLASKGKSPTSKVSVLPKGERLRAPSDIDSVFMREVGLPRDDTQPALIGRPVIEGTVGFTC